MTFNSEETANYVAWSERGAGAVQKLWFGQQQVPVSYWLAQDGTLQATRHWSRAKLVARPGSESTYKSLGAASAPLRFIGVGLGFVIPYTDQLRYDKEQPDFDIATRHARCAYRSALVGGAGFAGGKLGAAACSVLSAAGASATSAFLSGAALGTMAAPGPGTFVCGILGGIGGGIVGGYLAAKAATAVVDCTIDPVGQCLGRLHGWLME
ncbi:hypothetical protein ACFYW6_34085 [Streptomyces sp. NPDC002659]|uniref:hypothetical protein n=1 Tax=Streptomyces sp. NPDC002659 TaxID=3364656 RepID=UPI0036C70F50